MVATSSADAPDRPHDVRVRPMVGADLDETLELFTKVAEEGRWVGTEAGFDRAQRRAGMASRIDKPDEYRLVVAVADGRIVGNGGIELTGYGVAELGMAVADGWRGRGVGGRILDALVDEARDLGAHKVALQVWPHNERALALYRSRGFADEGRLVRHYRRTNGELWDAIVMGLPLDDTSPGSPYGDEPLRS